MANTWVQDWAWAFTTGAWALWALAAVILWVALLKDRSRGRRRCPKCWYDMTGVPGRKCPECGREARREKKLFSTRRRWRLAAFGVALALVAVASHRAPTALRHGVWAAVPIPVLNFVLGFWEEEAKALYETEMANCKKRSSGGPLVRTSWEKLLIASAVDELPELLRIEAYSVQWRNAYDEIDLIRRLGLEMRPAIPVLKDALHSEDNGHAEFAAMLLETCAATGATEATEVLVDAALHARWLSSKVHAMDALVSLSATTFAGERAIHRVIDHSQDATILKAAARAVVWRLKDSPADRRIFDQLLTHRNPIVRSSAVEICAPRIQQWMVDPVYRELASRPSAAMLDAVAQIQSDEILQEPRWIRTIHPLTSAESEALAIAAANALARFSIQSQADTAPFLSALRESPHPGVRSRLVQAVPFLPIEPSAASAHLQRMLREEGSASVRADAADAAQRLRSHDPQLIESLRRALVDSSSAVRQAAARTLAYCIPRTVEGREILEHETLSSEDPDVRLILLPALVVKHPTNAERALLLWRALERDTSPKVRAVALRSLALYPEERELLLSRASQALQSESSELLIAALNVLGRMGPLAAGALDRIRELESSPDPRIAAAARDAREKIEVAPR